MDLLRFIRALNLVRLSAIINACIDSKKTCDQSGDVISEGPDVGMWVCAFLTMGQAVNTGVDSIIFV